MKIQKVNFILSILIKTLIVVFCLFPFLFILLNSFSSLSEIEHVYLNTNDIDNEIYSFNLIPRKLSIEQYIHVLIERNTYIRMFFNSLILSISTVVLNTVLSIVTAYGFSKLRNIYTDKIFILYIILMIMPIQVMIIPNYLVIKELDLIDNYLSIILPGTFSFFGVFLLKQYMDYIPNNILEVAKLDGCSDLMVLLHIVIPNVKQGIIAVMMLSFIDLWNLIEQPLIYFNNKNMYPLSLYLSELKSEYFNVTFAASILFAVPVLIVLYFGKDKLHDGISKAQIIVGKYDDK